MSLQELLDALRATAIAAHNDLRTAHPEIEDRTLQRTERTLIARDLIDELDCVLDLLVDYRVGAYLSDCPPLEGPYGFDDDDIPF